MLMVPEILQAAIVGLMILIPTIVIYKKAGLGGFGVPARFRFVHHLSATGFFGLA